MNKTIVRCRCGHQVLSKEVLRTDLYERRAPGDAGREYVYVKYRCRRCKRMGEAFVAESRWDWAMLEAEPNEMNENERDRFLDEEPITQEELLDFHRDLQNFSLSDLAAMNSAPEVENAAREAAVTPLEKPEIASAAEIELKVEIVDSREDIATANLEIAPHIVENEITKIETASNENSKPSPKSRNRNRNDVNRNDTSRSETPPAAPDEPRGNRS